MMREHIARRALQAGPLEAYRIFHGEIDGAPRNWAVDRFGHHLLLRVPNASALVAHAGFVEALLSAQSWAGVVVKIRDDHSSRWLQPGHEGEQILREGPARLSVRLQDGYQVGLFIEGRALRDAISRHGAPGEVLSLFSYTGSASVRAALQGARLTSVDVSKKAHHWARRNFELSGVQPDGHRWFADDASSFLARSRDDAFETLILDPPAFGRAGRKTFKLERSLPELMEQSLRIARRIYFSTHHPKLTDNALEQAWAEAARRRGYDLRIVSIVNAFDLPEGGDDWGRYHRAMILERR